MTTQNTFQKPIIACALVAVILAVGMGLGFLVQWNVPLFYFLNGLPWPVLWSNLTELGDGLILGVLLFPLLRHKPQLLSAYLLGIVVNTLVVQGLKFSFALPRPAGVLDTETFRILGPVLTARAFPSGHTATIFLVAAIVTYMFRGSVRWLILLLASSVAISRVSVGAHWPQDILAGALIGWVIGCSVAYGITIRRLYPRQLLGLILLGSIYFLAGIIAIGWYPGRYPDAFLTHSILPVIAWIWGTILWLSLLKNWIKQHQIKRW